MESLTGKIFKLLPLRSGLRKDGQPWRAQEVVINLKGDVAYLCVTAWNEKVDILSNAKDGDDVEFEIFVRSREFKERWYTECSFVKLQLLGKYDDVKDDPNYPEVPDQQDGDSLPF